ncbi:hypothetical protein POTOM_045329 [Populus tomentosa]|uniref:Uncharacterized protein n=1 Tax=Populus tomentosa TaxID=118781 RepID=A0A8X8CD10_POPTO|nr:hypothetical protein POTOM_045329 [Populus tomentosa]
MPSTITGIDPENPALDVTPSHFHERVFSHDGSKDAFFCERVKVSGHLRWKLSRYASSFRVTLAPSALIPERFHSNIQVCFHRNASLGLCQCEKDDWRNAQKGLWTSVMSPYEERYVDVKLIGDTSGSVSIAVDEDLQQWRLMCLAVGFVLLLLAPIVSSWVPFYYSTSMAIGVFLVIIILLFQVLIDMELFYVPNIFSSWKGLGCIQSELNLEKINHPCVDCSTQHAPNQMGPVHLELIMEGDCHDTLLAVFSGTQGMKLLPTGRKNFFYLSIYGSVLGAGTFILHQISTLVNSILVNFGLSEDMHNPVYIFILVGIVLTGAGLGFWMVRKFVISKDGSVDDGVAQFVKWAMRIIASTFILQVSSSLFDKRKLEDDNLLSLTCFNGLGLCTCGGLKGSFSVHSDMPCAELIPLWPSTLDTPLAMGALLSSCAICSVTLKWWYKRDQSDSGGGSAWLQPAGQTTARFRRAEFHSRSGKMSPQGKMWNSPKSSSAWTSSPVKGVVSPSSHSATVDKQDYYSTFHKTPRRKKFTKKQWEDFTRESTREALMEWAASPEAANWIINNADRMQLLPSNYGSEEMVGSESDSTDASVAGSGKPFSLFNW